MDAYTFMRVDCGKVADVMGSLVATKGVARAAALTGRFDVVARLEDVSWSRLSSFGMNDLGRMDGVRETQTAVAVDPKAMDIVFPPLPLPIKKRELRRGALVFARIAMGSGADVLRELGNAEGIDGVALLTGEDDLLIQVAGDSVDAVARTVLRSIHPIRGIERTSTSLILAVNPVRLPQPGRPAPRRKPGRPRRS